MGFWAALAISIAFSVVAELIRPKQAVPNAMASALDEFDVPTAEAGRVIPVLVGKLRVTGSNMTWMGDLRSVALTRKVKTGMFSSARQTYAYRYYLGTQQVIAWGRGDVVVHDVRFDNLKGAWVGHPQPDGSERMEFHQERLYGGDEDEGGISGWIHFYRGSQTQLPNAYLAAKVKEPVPAYLGLCYFVMEGFYVGTNKYIKAISMLVSSYPNQLGMTGGMHVIGEDANPACFIYEVLTDKIWAVGKPSAQLDVASFRQVGETLYNEKLGMSMLYNGSSTAEDIIADVLRHIDGAIFTDPQTGLVTLALARNDYNPADLIEFDEDDFIEGLRFSRPSWNETRNTIQVTFVDRTNEFEPTPIPLQDLANITQREGEIASENVDFSGFTTREAATAMGLRTLKTYAYPLAAAQLVLTRKAWKMRPAAVFKVSWPRLGINGLIMRATRVDVSGIAENRIVIDAVEDIFSVGRGAYDPPPSSDWVNPVQPPNPVLRQNVTEAPYFLTALDDANIVAFASPDGALNDGFDIMTGYSAADVVSTGGSNDFTTSAILTASYPIGTSTADPVGPSLGGFANTEELNVNPSANDVAIGDTIVMLRSATTEEMISYTTIDIVAGTMTGVQRGLFDTVPQDHPPGTQAWFVTTGFAQANPQPYSVLPVSVYLKLLPYTALGSIDPDDATVMSVTLTGRAAAPYPPGRIRVNGVYPPALVGTVSGTFGYAWAHRNRTVGQLVTQGQASVTVEEGVTYTIRVLNGAGALLVEKTGINPSATTASIGLAYTGTVTVEIFAVRAGRQSWRRQRHSFAYNGTGITTSVITADEAQYILDGGGARG